MLIYNWVLDFYHSVPLHYLQMERINTSQNQKVPPVNGLKQIYKELVDHVCTN